MSREIDWDAKPEQSVQGQPKAFFEHNLALRRAADEIRLQPYEPFGPTPEQRQRLDEELKALVQRAKPARGASLRMKVIPEGKSIQFTPMELYRAATDPKFAAEIFTDATGIEDPNRQDIQEFQSRIYEKHPSVIQAGEEGRLEHIPEEEIREHLPKLPSEQLERPEVTMGRYPELPPIPEIVHGAPGVEPRPLPPREIRELPILPGQLVGRTAGVIKEDTDRYLRGEIPLEAVGQEIINSSTPWNAPEGAPGGTHYKHNVLLPQFRQQLADYQRYQNERPRQEAAYAEQKRLWDAGRHREELAHQHEERAREAQNRQHDYEQEHRRLAEAENTPEAREAREAEKRRVFDQLQREYSENLKGRTKLPQEEAALRHKYATVAPMNETHAEAARRVRAQVGAHEPAMNDINRAIREAGAQNISDVVQPHIAEAKRHPTDFVDQYKNQYENDVIANMKKEMEENFLEKVLPSINARVSPMSGARHALLQHYAENMQKDLNRKIAEMRHQNFSEAMKHGQQHRGIMLETGKATGQAAQMQHENKIREAEAIRQQASTQKGMGLMDVQNISGLAHQKQQQAQNEINERRAEHARKEAYAKEQVRFPTEIAHNLPASQTVASHLAMQPPPQAVSPLQLGTQLMGPLHQMLTGQQLPQAKASGGQVVNPDIAAHEAAIQEMENKMRNNHFDTWGNMINNISAHAMDNPQSMMQGFGRGLQQSNADRSAHQQHQTGLYEKIMNSRAARQKVLHEHERHKEELGETKRHNMSMETLKGQELDTKEHSQKLSGPDAQIMKEYAHDIKISRPIEKLVKKLLVLNNNIKGGSLLARQTDNPNMLARMGVGRQADIEKFQNGTRQLAALASQQQFGSKAGFRILQAIQQFKAGTHLTPEGNEEALNNVIHPIQDLYKEGKYINEQRRRGVMPSEATIEYEEEPEQEDVAAPKETVQREAAPAQSSWNPQMESRLEELARKYEGAP